eukprot:TRINITY_DN35871_c0_g3_i3.p1 TRINITY_DN35871_c0_g3~~TRINITY_DN35871_c0_g3_i3.p1  ORF type:complete len:173 (+),score=13.98 TRINITY_DN35871_c0_g3_i3:111-629(+)
MHCVFFCLSFLPSCPQCSVQLCQLNPTVTLPIDEPCGPCTADDYTKTVEDCVDADGHRNVTYEWRQPKLCSSSMSGAVELPESVVVGFCEQKILYVPSSKLSPKWIALFALVAVLIVCFGVLSFTTWLKARRLRQMYERLVEAELQMEAEMDDLTMEHEGREDKRLTESSEA